jgi:ABC-type transport system substrate-binding protein
MKFPSKSQLQQFFDVLNKKEKILFSFFLFLFFSSLTFSLYSLYLKHTKSIPDFGGTIVEGTVESIQTLNPLFVSTQPEKDIVELLLSPLFEIKGNEILPKLAEKLEILDGGKTFKIKLKDKIFWEDGKEITADDVEFTVALLQDPETKSPQRIDWLGVEVEKLSDKEILFKLREPSISFLKNLELRPIPKHQFERIPRSSFLLATENLFPLSSGPYKIENVKEKNGKIEAVSLTRNERYFGDFPKIAKLIFLKFENENELKQSAKEGIVDSFLLKEKEEFSKFQSFEIYLPRYFALFLNLNSKLLKDERIRHAIFLSVDKKRILKENFGKVKNVESPLLEKSDFNFDFNLEEAKKILEEAGFQMTEKGFREKRAKEEVFEFKRDLKMGDKGEDVKKLQECLSKFEEIYPSKEVSGFFGFETKRAVILFQEKFKDEILVPFGLEKGNGEVRGKTREKLNQVCFQEEKENLPLKVSLVTVKEKIAEKTAQIIKENLEKIGFQVELKIFEPEKIKEVLQKKDYDLLIFGQMYDKIVDPFLFWHSLQNEDIFNLSNLKDEKIDELLISQRREFDFQKRKETLKNFEKELFQKKCVYFLYNLPVFYYLSNKIKGFSGGDFNSLEDRFSQIEQWYIKEKRTFK